MSNEKLPPVGVWQGWAATEGNKCPVPEGTLVNVILRADPFDSDPTDYPAEIYSWEERGTDTILAYCVTQYPKVKRSGWVNLYRAGVDMPYPGSVHGSRENAVEFSGNAVDYITTAYLEWEE